jgi:hypothetical protein
MRGRAGSDARVQSIVRHRLAHAVVLVRQLADVHHRRVLLWESYVCAVQRVLVSSRARAMDRLG